MVGGLRLARRNFPLRNPGLLLLFLAAPVSAQFSKEAMHQRMLELARQMDAIKPGLASNPADAHRWSLMRDEYRRISEALGGDDPGGSVGGFFSESSGAAPTGVSVSAPPNCSGPFLTFENDGNVVIPTGPAVVTSQIVVSDLGPYLWDVTVETFITHTFAADLDITLTSPQGTVVTLTTDNGSVNDNVFNGTNWSDKNNPGGQVPYTINSGLTTDHPYSNNVVADLLAPEEALAAFREENPNGTWTLRISDDSAGDGGLLSSWSLTLVALPSPPSETQGFGVIHSTAIPIPAGPAVVSSTVNFQPLASFESICEVQVIAEITHSFAADLDITLTSPAGTVATLTSDNGSDNDDVFDGTFWLDVADSDGQVPYETNAGLTTDHPYADATTAAILVPEEGMGAFKGEDAVGTWTLTISDDRAGDGGTLHSWSVGAFPCSCTRGVGPRRADAHASGGVSNVNGVVEPGERFLFEPRVANAGGSFVENFEQAIPPVLPSVWGVNLAVGQTGDLPWSIVDTMSDSPPHSAFATTPSHVTDNRLHFPSLPVNLSNRILQFRHYFDMHKPFDGGVLEISIGGGAFQDISAAGGLFLLGGYTSVISGMFGSPIAGRMAWSGESGGYITTRVFLPAAAVGNTVVLRFRAATDNSLPSVGWSIDNVSLGNFNTSAATTAESAGLGGPPGPVYTTHDDTASYGVPIPGASHNCFDATGDCYELEVSNPPVRPALHWDAGLAEFLSPGNRVDHSIHIGNSFADVSIGNPFYRFIETLLHFGITGGCGPTTYCPGSNVLREQMAVFLLVARFGTGYTPPACVAPVFADVPCSSPFAAWINELSAQGITGGCGGGNFCPAAPVLREQMAVFLLVAYEGTGYVPPACTVPSFTDVPCASVYSRWINELARRQVTGGCGGGNYCPTQAVTREQMAVFLAVTFALHLY